MRSIKSILTHSLVGMLSGLFVLIIFWAIQPRININSTAKSSNADFPSLNFAESLERANLLMQEGDTAVIYGRSFLPTRVSVNGEDFYTFLWKKFYIEVEANSDVVLIQVQPTREILREWLEVQWIIIKG
jgi:hypothetical protein